MSYTWDCVPRSVVLQVVLDKHIVSPAPSEKNLILNLTFEFALGIIAYSESLDTARKYAIAKQILRSGTSIGASIREAQNAESRNDFIHKVKISAKEADETEYWLLLCKFSPGYPDCNNLLEKVGAIQRILTRIITTSRQKVQSTGSINS